MQSPTHVAELSSASACRMGALHHRRIRHQAYGTFHGPGQVQDVISASLMIHNTHFRSIRSHPVHTLLPWCRWYLIRRRHKIPHGMQIAERECHGPRVIIGVRRDDASQIKGPSNSIRVASHRNSSGTPPDTARWLFRFKGELLEILVQIVLEGTQIAKLVTLVTCRHAVPVMPPQGVLPLSSRRVGGITLYTIQPQLQNFEFKFNSSNSI